MVLSSLCRHSDTLVVPHELALVFLDGCGRPQTSTPSARGRCGCASRNGATSRLDEAAPFHGESGGGHPLEERVLLWRWGRFLELGVARGGLFSREGCNLDRRRAVVGVEDEGLCLQREPSGYGGALLAVGRGSLRSSGGTRGKYVIPRGGQVPGCVKDGRSEGSIEGRAEGEGKAEKDE